MVLDFFKNITNTIRFIIFIISGLLIIISASIQVLLTNNNNAINNLAEENVKMNILSLTNQLEQSITNELDVVSSNLHLLSNSPAMKGNKLTSITLLEASQEATQSLTASYGWTDNIGNIKWATNLNNDTLYTKFLGHKVAFSKFFVQASSALGPYFTPLALSITNMSRIFITYPIFISATNNTLLDISHIYTTENLDELVKNQKQQEKNSNKTFTGLVYASIDVDKLTKTLNSLITTQDNLSLFLFDKAGKTIYSNNPIFSNMLLDNNNHYKELENHYDNDNSKIINQLKEAILSGKQGIISVNDKNNTIDTFSYTPISNNDQNVFYLVLKMPHFFATEVNQVVSQQASFIIGSFLAIGAIVIVLLILQALLNKSLKKEIGDKTSKLKETIELLEKSNEQLKYKEKAQKEFINIATHELRTPVQSVSGFMEMIETFPTKTAQYVVPLKRNVDRLTNLVEDLLDVIKFEDGKIRLLKTTFDMNEKIKNVIVDITVNKELFHKSDVKLVFHETKSPVMVYADRVRIFQVLNNLLTNAIKYTKEGVVNIYLETYYDKEKDKELALVKVKDCGQSIDSQIMPRLFEKFSSKSESGTGLGLYIAKSIVEEHGGTIRGYNSNTLNPTEKGATFEFTLPLSPMEDIVSKDIF